MFPTVHRYLQKLMHFAQNGNSHGDRAEGHFGNIRHIRRITSLSSEIKQPIEDPSKLTQGPNSVTAARHCCH